MIFKNSYFVSDIDSNFDAADATSQEAIKYTALEHKLLCFAKYLMLKLTYVDILNTSIDISIFYYLEFQVLSPNTL